MYIVPYALSHKDNVRNVVNSDKAGVFPKSYTLAEVFQIYFKDIFHSYAIYSIPISEALGKGSVHIIVVMLKEMNYFGVPLVPRSFSTAVV